jgi:hypothetical protein
VSTHVCLFLVAVVLLILPAQVGIGLLEPWWMPVLINSVLRGKRANAWG